MSVRFELDLARRPYRDFHPRFRRVLAKLGHWPAPEAYDDLAREVPQAADIALPRFVTEDRDSLRRAGGYEQHVARCRAVPTRPQHWHDLFNMSVWAHFPRLRWALNALHVDEQLGPKDPRNGRAPAQNLAASFDESGMLVVSTSREILSELRELQFRQVFWERRDELLATTRFWLVGHGLLESLVAPHQRLAARSLQVWVPSLPEGEHDDQHRFDLDAGAAASIAAWRHTRSVLDPIPLLAIPGYSDNDSRDFYDDPHNLVFEPISRRPP